MVGQGNNKLSGIFRNGYAFTNEKEVDFPAMIGLIKLLHFRLSGTIFWFIEEIRIACEF
ncbi:hypothetical protein AusDCA_1478 [Desulfitobacterium sp. AusDCA]